MQFTLAAIVTLIAAVSAQSWDDIPACAVPCIQAATTAVTSCALDDVACICASRDAVTIRASSCVISACGLSTAINEVIPAVNAACDSV
ncbi:putative extracellular membrane CFEM domain protein [Rosellinia necatrix]|uniref:Putative extracellular membrane CFEM domain protein n=1 Tax=Rosellinia necatrix TaxID=77044 RepID=A0A1S7UNP0_ROSNE|nr:putative extracellular membrane CFEM domain protein [Rosellinia necatrix]